MSIDEPSKNDNRHYDFTQHPDDQRQEYSVISKLIPLHSKVIDLGCGNGTLLHQLKEERKAIVKGVELSTSGVQVCREKGLDILHGRIDEHLPLADNSFDYAICNVTIQMVLYPEILLREMKRLARFQIISFPNFAFYRNRIELSLYGKMPTSMLFNYEWYNTGHIHQLSFKDFMTLMHTTGGLVLRELHYVETPNTLKNYLMRAFPNIFMHIPIILLEKIHETV
jgi:methionine biosynthesis protein MetW